MEVRTCGSVNDLLTHPELSAGCCAIVDARTLGRDRELLERLESNQETLPVVLIADHVSRRMLIRSLSADAFCIVEKPVLDDALLQSIKAVRRR
jgi:FixJ family two-component response regulator